MPEISGSKYRSFLRGRNARRQASGLILYGFLVGLSRALPFSFDNQAEAQRLFEEAQAAKTRGDLQLAEQKYLDVIRLAPDSPNACQNLGIVYFTGREFQKAASMFAKAIKLSPELAPAHFMLGLSYYELYESQKAIESFQRAIRLSFSDTNEGG